MCHWHRIVTACVYMCWKVCRFINPCVYLDRLLICLDLGNMFSSLLALARLVAYEQVGLFNWLGSPQLQTESSSLSILISQELGRVKYCHSQLQCGSSECFHYFIQQLVKLIKTGKMERCWMMGCVHLEPETGKNNFILCVTFSRTVERLLVGYKKAFIR